MKSSEELPLSVTAMLSLATAVVLLGMMGGRSLLGALIELGQATEEVFRGDRLPILNFPETEIKEEPEA